MGPSWLKLHCDWLIQSESCWLYNSWNYSVTQPLSRCQAKSCCVHVCVCVYIWEWQPMLGKGTMSIYFLACWISSLWGQLALVCPEDYPAKPLQYCFCPVQGQVLSINRHLRQLRRDLTVSDTFSLWQKHKNMDMFLVIFFLEGKLYHSKAESSRKHSYNEISVCLTLIYRICTGTSNCLWYKIYS